LEALIKINVSRFAEKQIARLPSFVIKALQYWMEAVELKGLAEIRKSRGYHDELLKGQRFGQRSVRLTRAYRVIYVETIEGLEVLVLEVNKHEY